MLCGIMLSAVVLSGDTLSAVMMNGIMLSAVMLSGIMLNLPCSAPLWLLYSDALTSDHVIISQVRESLVEWKAQYS
jgi:hypothetical protein